MRIILHRIEVRKNGRLSLINNCPVCKKEHRYGKRLEEMQDLLQNPKKLLCSFSLGTKISHCLRQSFQKIELFYYPSITKILH